MDHIVDFFKGFDAQSIISLAVMLWFFKNHLDKKFDKIDARFDKVDETLKEHGERLAFLEVAGIYTMPMESSQPNPRSAAAKEMWKRRRAKKITHSNS